MRCKFVALILVACCAGPALAEEMLQAGAAAGGAASPTTLWNFLGIPQGVNKIRDATSNRNGNRPGNERTPALLGISDPKNLQSDVPAIKKAAKVKAAEDLAPQKVKALKYLARIGCGCYDKDGEVTEAFLAALDDCTEEVRFQAAINILDAANNHCKTCGMNCCCKEEIAKKLAKIAYERNDKCGYLEPSARVREAAIDALQACCKGGGYAPPGVPGLENLPAPEMGPGPSPAPEPPPEPGRSRAEEPTAEDGQSSKIKGQMASFETTRIPAVTSPEPAVPAGPLPPAPLVHGSVENLNLQFRTAEVSFDGVHGLQVGHHLTVNHHYPFGPATLGEMEVIGVQRTSVTVRAIGKCRFEKMAVGDCAFTVETPAPQPTLPAALPEGYVTATDQRLPTVQAPAAQAPVPLAPVAQAPVAQTPVAQAPVAQAPVAQAPAAQPTSRLLSVEPVRARKATAHRDTEANSNTATSGDSATSKLPNPAPMAQPATAAKSVGPAAGSTVIPKQATAEESKAAMSKTQWQAANPALAPSPLRQAVATPEPTVPQAAVPQAAAPSGGSAIIVQDVPKKKSRWKSFFVKDSTETVATNTSVPFDGVPKLMPSEKNQP